MSTLYVRSTVETWLQNAAGVVPYYRTVNTEQQPQDDVWMSATFDADYTEVMTFCRGDVREEGEIELIYMGLAGEGFDRLLTAAESHADQVLANNDPNDKLVLLKRTAPIEYTGGGFEGMYSVSIYLSYHFYS